MSNGMPLGRYLAINGISFASFSLAPVLGLDLEEIPAMRDLSLVYSVPDSIANPTSEEEGLFGAMVVGSDEYPNQSDYDFLEKAETFHSYVGQLDPDNPNRDTLRVYAFDVPEQYIEDMYTASDKGVQHCSESFKLLVINTYPQFEDELKEILYEDAA